MNLVIVDTQLSNVKSLTEAVTLLSDAKVSISNDPEKLLQADKVILPGVGAFSRCMERLSKVIVLTLWVKLPAKEFTGNLFRHANFGNRVPSLAAIRG